MGWLSIYLGLLKFISAKFFFFFPPSKVYNFLHTGLWASQVAPMVKNLPANAGDARDTGSDPGLGRSPGVGNANLLQYSCLETFHGQRSLVGYSPWGHKELDMTEHARARAHTHTHTHTQQCKSFTSLVKFILGYFPLLDAIVNGIAFLTFQIAYCWCTETQLIFLCLFCILQFMIE